MNRAKTLVTGATGMTGSHTVEMWRHLCQGPRPSGVRRAAPPPAKRHRPQNVADALRDADGAPREGKPLLDLSNWAAD